MPFKFYILIYFTYSFYNDLFLNYSLKEEKKFPKIFIKKLIHRKKKNLFID